MRLYSQGLIDKIVIFEREGSDTHQSRVLTHPETSTVNKYPKHGRSRRKLNLRVWLVLTLGCNINRQWPGRVRYLQLAQTDMLH